MTRRRAIIALLVSFLATVAALELGLRIADPLGALRYFGDLRTLYSVVREDPRGYGMLPGTYTFSNWTATILPDATRRVPDTAPRGCIVALVGDSATFALGVSDADTWVNLVARELPGVRIVNAGMPAFNVWNVAATIEYVKASGYVYLIIDNDDEPEPNWRDVGKRREGTAIQTYLYTLEFPRNPYTPLPGARAKIAEIADRRNVQAVAFEGNVLAKGIPGVVSIPPYTKRISHADAHADVEGNRQIAASMLPIVREFTARVCG